MLEEVVVADSLAESSEYVDASNPKSAPTALPDAHNSAVTNTAFFIIRVLFVSHSHFIAQPFPKHDV
jgi:hypothetical protein